MSVAQATRVLRRAYRDNSKFANVTLVDDEHAWYGLTTARQALNCLKDGQVVDGPTPDERGNFTCRVDEREERGNVALGDLMLFTDGGKDWSSNVLPVAAGR